MCAWRWLAPVATRRGADHARWTRISPDGAYTALRFASVLEIVDREGRRVGALARESLEGGAYEAARGWSPRGETLLVQRGMRVELVDARRATLRAAVTIEALPAELVFAWRPDGAAWAVGLGDGRVQLHDARGELVRELRGPAGAVTALAWDLAGTRLASGHRGAAAVALWDPATGHPVGELPRQETGVSALTGEPLAPDALAWREDGAHLAATLEVSREAGGAQLVVWDVARRAVALRKTWPGALRQRCSWMPGRPVLACGGDVEGYVRVPDGAELHVATARQGDRDATVIYADDGLFAGDEEAFERVTFRVGDDLLASELVTADQLFERFYRASLVEDFLAGRPLEPPRDVRDGVGLPPAVAFAAPLPEAVDDARLPLRVGASDRGGGVSEVRVFVNGARADAGRGLRIAAGRPAGDAAGERTLDALLSPGENEVVVEAYNARGHVRSERLRARVTLRAAAVRRPDLHLVAVTCNDYDDPTQALQYPNPDGDAVIAAFAAQRGRLFADVRVTRVRDREGTRDRIKAALRDVARAADTADVFVFYAAGHGLALACEGEPAARYRLLTAGTSLRREATVCAQSLSDEDLAALLRPIPARKKLLILDTCQAGGAAAERILVAMRGAEEVEAIQRLARAEGVAVLAAAAAQQSAGEVRELGHGVFTYALLQGLRGDAALRGAATVSVAGLTAYLDEAVPALAERYFHRPQYPITSHQGQDFPLALR